MASGEGCLGISATNVAGSGDALGTLKFENLMVSRRDALLLRTGHSVRHASPPATKGLVVGRASCILRLRSLAIVLPASNSSQRRHVVGSPAVVGSRRTGSAR